MHADRQSHLGTVIAATGTGWDSSCDSELNCFMPMQQHCEKNLSVRLKRDIVSLPLQLPSVVVVSQRRDSNSCVRPAY